MKLVKRIFIILLIVMFVLPIISYAGIVVTNNSIADEIEKDLASYVSTAHQVEHLGRSN